MRDEVLEDLEAVARFARRLAPRLRPGDVVLLDGPLGAGKTTMVRALVEALGGDPASVSSPTFTLMHRYEAHPPIVHVDAYRLAGADELAAIGFDEERQDAVACVEWAERITGLVPPGVCWRIVLAHHDGRGRLLRLEGPPERDPAADGVTGDNP